MQPAVDGPGYALHRPPEGAERTIEAHDHEGEREEEHEHDGAAPCERGELARNRRTEDRSDDGDERDGEQHAVRKERCGRDSRTGAGARSMPDTASIRQPTAVPTAGPPGTRRLTALATSCDVAAMNQVTCGMAMRVSHHTQAKAPSWHTRMPISQSGLTSMSRGASENTASRLGSTP